MAPWKQITRRVAFAVFAIYLVMSITFGFVTLTADPQIGLVAYGAGHSVEAQKANESEREKMVQEAIAEYKEEHNLDDPVHERYLRWVVDITTLDWGRSETQHAPVTTVLGEAIPNTLAYLVPAMILALVGGLGLGVYAALNPGTILERLSSGGLYLTYGIPNYWLAFVFLMLGLDRKIDVVGQWQMITVVLPAAILGLSLLAGQLRYARAESQEYVNTEFLKLVRAKGASNWRVARHVLRNAALPLVSLFFADLLGVLVVNVFVLEQVLNIRGIGWVGFVAIQQRDLPLILGVGMVLAFAGIVGNLIQDIAHVALDPRVDSE